MWLITNLIVSILWVLRVQFSYMVLAIRVFWFAYENVFDSNIIESRFVYWFEVLIVWWLCCCRQVLSSIPQHGSDCFVNIVLLTFSDKILLEICHTYHLRFVCSGCHFVCYNLNDGICCDFFLLFSGDWQSEVWSSRIVE